MIAHVDADAFFASVLQRKNRQLKGKPLLALGAGGGCVIAASYEAKAYGVKTGMRFVDAKKLVPHAIAVPSDFHEACIASDQIERILHDDCATIEQFSVDEWFLDLHSRQGGAPQSPQQWAEHTQRHIANAVELTVSVGIGSSKMLAKMASEYRKPAGATVIRNEDIAAFLQDRAAAAIPGIGPRRMRHTEAHGWKTAWDIANADPETIIRLFGRPGREMQLELLGHCLFPVAEDREPPKSVSRCRSFRPTSDRSLLFAHILAHLTRTIMRMRGHALACQRVCVWLRDGEYEHGGCEHKLPQPCDTEEQLLPHIRECFETLYRPGKRYTQAGLALLNLQPSGQPQYSLLEAPMIIDRSKKIQSSLDLLRERYGRDAVIRGAAMSVAHEKKSKEPDIYGKILSCN